MHRDRHLDVEIRLKVEYMHHKRVAFAVDSIHPQYAYLASILLID